jgi:dimethylglycine dehydrogenase
VKTKTKAVVIGGGVVGASVLYHLTKLGWDDVVLLERKQLTAGSTWHAAAGFHSLNGDPNVARLQAYTISLYKEIQEISGQDVGLHVCGGILTASSQDRWDFLKSVHALNRTIGIESKLLTPEECAELTEIMDTSGILGGLYDENEGYLDPYGCTHAYAKAAKMGGAQIHERTMVSELNPIEGGWEVVTDKGTIITEHVINAAGLWAREVGHMVGVDLPLMPFEHHYLITENIKEIEDQDKESAVTVDLDGGIYTRQEQSGVLYGVYEKGCKAWSVDGTPWDYGETDLLPSRLDDLIPTLEKGFERFPRVAEAGIKNIINGPFTFTPDGNPLVGPVRGINNYWVACGSMAGFSQGGGIGLTLAQWMIEGEPEGDVFGMDVARYGDFATQAYTLDKATEFYERRMDVPFPNEDWPAARPSKVTPIYERQKTSNACFGASFGQEIPLWYAPEGTDPVDIPTFYRSNAFDVIGEEARHVRNQVGLMDASSFSKYEVTGPGAKAWLDKILASKISSPGRARLAVMLSEKGKIIGDLTLMCFSEERYMLTGSGYLQEWHMRWFEKFLPAEGVQVRNVTDELLAVGIVGPKSREVLQKLTKHDISHDNFKFLSAREINIGYAPAKVVRMSLSGSLGYEIYVPAQFFATTYDKIMEAGKDEGIRDIGIRAILSLRLEKGYGIWSREFSPDYTPAMNDMGHFVDYNKPNFIGREAALLDRDTTPARKLVTIEIDADNADAQGYEPILIDDVVVGFVTSGGYAHHVEKSLAMAYIDTDKLDENISYDVSIMGENRKAKLLTECAYDPEGSVMRS